MELLRFRKSRTKNKKYDAIVVTKSGRQRTIPFGDSRYQQFADNTGLGLYTHLNHRDPDRRANYRRRHRSPGHQFSASWFSWHYLW